MNREVSNGIGAFTVCHEGALFSLSCKGKQGGFVLERLKRAQLWLWSFMVP